MTQQELFPQNGARATWQLFVDGAARNNPGPAGAGICLCKNGVECTCDGYFLGTATNNEAEYQALVLGLILAQRQLIDGDKLEIFSDSELLVKQILGMYKVKKPELRAWHERAKKLLLSFSYSIRHVVREKNMRADELANRGIDKKNMVPEEIQQEILAL
jgi:ribonuclease HI